MQPSYKITQDNIDELKRIVEFYKSNTVMIVGGEDYLLDHFNKIAFEYLNYNVSFTFESTVNSSYDFVADSPLALVGQYFLRFQKPIIYVVNIEEECEIIPLESYDNNSEYRFFGPWATYGTEFNQEIIDRWFFEALSTKDLWQDINGNYSYPKNTPQNKEILKKLIQEL